MCVIVGVNCVNQMCVIVGVNYGIRFRSICALYNLPPGEKNNIPNIFSKLFLHYAISTIIVNFLKFTYCCYLMCASHMYTISSDQHKDEVGSYNHQPIKVPNI